MFEVSKSSVIARLAVAVCLAALPCAAHAQASPAGGVPSLRALANGIRPSEVQVSVTYDVGDANLTSTDPFSFLFQGGSVEVEEQVYKKLGIAESFTGFHTSNSGQGVPINLITFAFGPRYTFRKVKGKHYVDFYGQGLIGEADGFSGLYPMPGGAVTSASSLALQTGGGVDIDMTRHFSFRVLEADWLRTYLPDSRENVENTFRLGAGVVFHTAPR